MPASASKAGDKTGHGCLLTWGDLAEIEGERRSGACGTSTSVDIRSRSGANLLRRSRNRYIKKIKKKAIPQVSEID